MAEHPINEILEDRTLSREDAECLKELPPRAWHCACGWEGSPDNMIPTPAGGLACPKCGGTGGLRLKR